MPTLHINFEAIAELREGHTGHALAALILNSIKFQVAKVPHLEDRKSQEIGLLTYELKKVCDLLAIAVEPPDGEDSLAAQEAIDERSPLCDTLRASIRQVQQRKDAERNMLARQHGKHLARRYDDVPAKPSAFQGL